MSDIAQERRRRGHATSIKDPALYEEIMRIGSALSNKGFELEACRRVLEARGFVLSQTLVYRALQVLLRSKLLKRDYSLARRRVVYRLNLEHVQCTI